MTAQTDHQLLKTYAERSLEPAFTELVRRHVDFVYSAAIRMVRDSHLAEDVTQGVFIALAKQASDLVERATLAGWLHRTTQNIACQTVRTIERRRAREQEAVAMNELFSSSSEAFWEQIEPHLDAALGELSDVDREAVLLRYFQKKSAAEIASILGVSDEAAQKRLSRAVERLREFFAKRDVTVGASGLVVVITANAVQAAPVGLIATISAAALGGTAAATSTLIAATTKTIAMTTLQKTLVAVTIATLAGAGIYEARQAAQLREQVQTVQQQQATQSEQLQKERNDATNQLTYLRNELEKGKDNQLELLKLRGEIGLLRSRSALLEKMTKDSKPVPSEVLVTRAFRVDAKAFREKLEEVMQPPANTTTAKIASDYFATKGINLDSPKSIQFADASGALFVHTTETDLAKIEKLIGELIPLHKFQVHIKARFIELPKATFAEFSGLFSAKGSNESGLVGISNDEQFRKTLKLLEEKDGVETFGEPEVVTLNERQTQMRTGDKETSEMTLDVTPYLLSDGYTIRLSALVTGPGQITAQANVWDNQTLILSKTEITNPEKQILVLITTTLVDEAGNRVYSEEDLPFAQSGVPAQE